MRESSVRVPKTAELIAEHLRTQVLRGELRPGETLSGELDLCERFGVSRPTLREAIRILESEQLVEVTRGRGGARIVAPTEAAVARYFGRYLQYAGVPMVDVHQATIALEVPAVVALARHRTPADLAVLEAALDEERRHQSDDNGEAVLAGTAFHRAIVDLSGNRTLAIMHGMVEEVAITASRTIAATMQAGWPEETQRFQRVHEEVVELIRARDADGAETLWRHHLAAKSRRLSNLAEPATSPHDGA